jgi:DNA-binding LacI/PurR family transcriptional regulator
VSGIREVAELAGVSIGTVSNVLNGRSTVSAANRARVESAIRDLGFVRNESARQLRAGSSRVLALMVLDLGNPFFSDVARGVEAVADEHGLMLSVSSTGESPEREDRYLDLIEEQRVHGLLITPVRDDAERLDQLARRGTPVVLVDRGSAGPHRCSVAVDDVEGGRMAARHLLDMGHRDLAYVGGPLDVRQVRDRLSGAREAVGEDATLIVVETPSLTVEAGRAAARALLDGPRPTAVFCANDLLALGVLQEVVGRGIKVPTELAIVGYDDIEYAAAAAIPLTSVRQPREQLGRAAAQLLIEEVDDPLHRHRQVVFQPDLVVRASSSSLEQR